VRAPYFDRAIELVPILAQKRIARWHNPCIYRVELPEKVGNIAGIGSLVYNIIIWPPVASSFTSNGE
jgi:hypothetical protein